MTRALVAAVSVTAACLVAATGVPGVAGADSFTPVGLSIQVTPTARLGAPLPVRVTVHADPGVLDTGSGPMRLEVKLAAECGGDFQHTAGVTLVNLPLSPQPSLGRGYQGAVASQGRPASYGPQTVCAYLEDSTVGRVYANDESTTVTVSPPCTAAGRRYDAGARALVRARRSLRRAHGRGAKLRARRLVTRRGHALAVLRRDGIAACGPGVTL